jgi:hypothetical protein
MYYARENRRGGFGVWFDCRPTLGDGTDCMAPAQRLDVEKGQYPVRFEQFEGGNVACRVCQLDARLEAAASC